MSRGYGNPRREYGSIGVFLDMSGIDFYSAAGYDSTLSNSTTWGVMSDYFLTDLPEQSSGDDFKVALDTSRTREQLAPLPFTIADYFIMAKTIEPRFSLWQELGFNKLVSDSINTADFVLTKLGTDDHRETQVMRVLTKRMGEALNNSVVNRLKDYSSGKTAMDQNEVSFACYLIGETGYSSGKDILLQLSYDSNYKICSSAINALGKIRLGSDDAEFKNKVSMRLIELVNENVDKKLYNKDIAFAFSKYQEKQNLDALLVLLTNKFYGARFLAADALEKYWNLYGAPDNNTLLNLESSKLAIQAFLYSLVDLPDDKFKVLIEQILGLPIASDEIVNLNLIDLLKTKNNRTGDETYKNYYSQILLTLEAKAKQKVR